MSRSQVCWFLLCWPNSSTTPSIVVKWRRFSCVWKLYFVLRNDANACNSFWYCFQLVCYLLCLSYSISATIGSWQDSASTIVTEMHFSDCQFYSCLDLHSIKFIKLQNFNVLLNGSSDILIDIYLETAWRLSNVRGRRWAGKCKRGCQSTIGRAST